MKNEKNRTFFKKKVKFDSHSIKQAFDFKPQDLANFHAKIDLNYKILIKIKGRHAPLRSVFIYITVHQS
ncbi:hypothetical protein B0182_01185 [Moraxella bovis]|nr:hypothetical protein B0182_01185 [Moraxella bovis]